MKRNPKWSWAVRAAARAKARAKERGVPFNLDSKYIFDLMSDECPVFGTPFVFLGAGQSPNGPALDRLVPGKGYVKGNVAVISVKANTIKSSFVSEDVWRVALWLSEQE